MEFSHFEISGRPCRESSSAAISAQHTWIATPFLLSASQCRQVTAARMRAVEPFGKALQQRLHELAQIMHTPRVTAADFLPPPLRLFVCHRCLISGTQWLPRLIHRRQLKLAPLPQQPSLLHLPHDFRHLRLVEKHTQPRQQFLVQNPSFRHRRHLQQEMKASPP
jgi:hypothetical protein